VSLAHADVGHGEMGTTLEAVQLVIDSGFQILNRRLAYATWHGTRQKAPSLTIQRDGVTVTLDDDEPETIARVLRALER